MKNSHFHLEACIQPHFILAGQRINDFFCTDRLQLVSMGQELSAHLRQQGFDAVIFMDTENRLYCYEEQSYYVLRNGALPTKQRERAMAEPQTLNSGISAKGPLGKRRSRTETKPVQHTQASSPIDRYNMGRMDIHSAWEHLNGLLKNESVRIAFVFANTHGLEFSFPVRTLHLLEELSANPRHSIAVYLFRDSSICASEGNGRNEWRVFYESVLEPIIQSTESCDADHFILLGMPNAAEIRNLLLHMRFRSNKPLAHTSRDIRLLSMELAAACARNKWGLEQLRIKLESFAEEHPREELSAKNWTDVVGKAESGSAKRQLHELIGLNNVKNGIAAWESMMRKRGKGFSMPEQSSRLTPPPPSVVQGHELNVQLIGSPGTGKTTIARILGRLYFEMGLLPTASTVEVNAGTIVSPNIGGTAQRLHQLMQQARGGVLFIDEAYALMNNAFGRDAIDQLVADTSAYAGTIAVVLAGYPGHIAKLMQENDGLPRRFPTIYKLEDYTPQEMRRILDYLAKKDHDTVLFGSELKDRLDDFCETWVSSRGRDWQNVGEAENLLNNMKKACSIRQSETKEFLLLPQDIPPALRYCFVPQMHNLEEAQKRIDNLIGLKNVKEFLNNRYLGIVWESTERFPGNYIFHGNPGTGKTYTARLLANILYLLGVLRRNRLVERRPDQLLNGDPMENLREAVEEARGAMLFIDEAHQLLESDAGCALIHALVPMIEHPEIHLDTCFVFAGYSAQMRNFIREDSGLERRIPMHNRIRFDDYTADELMQILLQMAEQLGERVSEGYQQRSLAALDRYLENRPENFGNGGYIRDDFLPKSIEARTFRLNEAYRGAARIAEQTVIATVSPEEKHTLTEADLPKKMHRLGGSLDCPVPPRRTADSRLRELVGKQQVLDYLTARTSGENEILFYGEENCGNQLHFSITGLYGSGRRTAVRAMAAVFHQMGVLTRNDVRFVGKGDLEASYVGQTAPKTAGVVEAAVGGTLAVMNPSALLPKNNMDNSYGPEALGVLTGALERDDLSMVFLDTEEGMQKLFAYAPQLQGRLERSFHFKPFTPEEHEKLFRMQTEQNMIFEDALEQQLPTFFHSIRGGNGNQINQLVSELRMNWKRLNGAIITQDGLPKRLITCEMFTSLTE